MALTDQQKKELDIASARQASGTASETDIQNINYAKQNLGYTYTSPTATPTSPQTAPTATQTQQTTQTPPPAQTDQQKGLQAAQDRIKAGTANDTDRANVNYAIQTGLIKPVVVNPTNNFEPQLPGGAVDNKLNANEISSNLTSPSTVITDRTAEDQAFKQAIADTTNSYLSGLDQQIAQLNNQYLSIIQKQEQAKQAEVDRLTAGYESAGNISLYDTQKDLLERFQVEANIELYKDLQTKAVDAAKMVQDGIDGLDTATYLTSVVSGRQNQLYKQGLNVITSLNATAEIVKGNIDIASGYVDSLISTLEKDRTTKLSVLGGLIDLHNADLINLKQDEKDIVEKQMALLEKEATQIQKNKDDIISMYNTNPYVAYKAGVYFTDTTDEALEKVAKFINENPEYGIDNVNYFTSTDSYGNFYSVAVDKYTGKVLYKENLGQIAPGEEGEPPKVFDIGGEDMVWNPTTQQFEQVSVSGESKFSDISNYQLERADRNLNSVDELFGKVSISTVGIGGLSSIIPGTPAADFKAELNTLKSNIAFGELTAMREASKTGGALGQVSDQEGARLEAALGALSTNQSPENFKEQLQKIKDSINRWYSTAFQQEYEKLGFKESYEDVVEQIGLQGMKKLIEESSFNQDQSMSVNGSVTGEYQGLPMYDTYSNNPGVNRSDRNNNPGNIKVSSYTKEFDGVIGVESKQAEDGGYFLVFDSPQAGANAVGRLLQEGRSYQGVTAEQAIKKYNGGGSYGARTLGLDPNKDFQEQIKNPKTLNKVVVALLKAEGYTGNLI